MGSRIELNQILTDLLGSSHVYFQPMTNDLLVYPCIVYSLDNMLINYADNSSYRLKYKYSITYMDTRTDFSIINALANLPTSTFVRRFVSDKIYHTVFEIYY